MSSCISGNNAEFQSVFRTIKPCRYKEQYIEKLSLLNSTGDNGPYSDKALNNSVHHVAPGVVYCGI